MFIAENLHNQGFVSSQITWNFFQSHFVVFFWCYRYGSLLSASSHVWASQTMLMC